MIPINREQILAVYAQYPRRPVELEARFGWFTPEGTFRSSVRRTVFNRVKDTFGNQTAPVIEKSTDYSAKNIRKTVIYREGQPDLIRWIQKSNITQGRWQLKQFDIRIAMKLEDPIAPVEGFNPTNIRHKKRFSYRVKGAVRIDLTEVRDSRPGRDDFVTYEVEVELLNPTQIDFFQRVMTMVLRSVQNTAIIYTNDTKRDLFMYLNTLLGGANQDGSALDDKVLVQARNLNYRDMVWGGIIGNPETSYTVTHKADGERRLLVYSPTGLWLAEPPYGATYLLNEVVDNLQGTVLDGELVPNDKQYRLAGAPTSTYWYLSFDCLADSRDTSVQRKPLAERMEVAKRVANRHKGGELLTINTKTFVAVDKIIAGINTAQERSMYFFETLKKMFAQQPSLAYRQDGFMFTPAFAVYNTGSDQKPLQKRVLTRYPDICKWKTQEQMTIDFQIRWEQGELTLLSTGEMGKLVPFRGSQYNQFTSEVDADHPLTKNTPSNSIVEYFYDFNQGMLVPSRIRTKVKPNRLEFAIANWDWLHDPITKETLTGESFNLLFKYHNQIKHHLYDSVSYTIPGEEAPTLLDIGSGRGGDVAKWKSFSKIVVVEPNETYLTELRRRIDLHGMTDRVHIVQTGGEDTDVITREVKGFMGGPVDVVSSMLSMSFFWQSNEKVGQLAQTITQNLKPRGTFIFFTIYGTAVKELFDPSLRGPVTNQFDMGTARLIYDPDKTPPELFIDLPGTIVQNQTEWLVYPYDLLFHMPEFQMKELHRAERSEIENFMSPKETLLNKMYAFGSLKRSDLPRPPFLKVPTVRQVPEKKVREEKLESPFPVKYPAIPATTEASPVRKVSPPPATLAATPTVTTFPKLADQIPISILPVTKPRNPKNPAPGDDAVQAFGDLVEWYPDVVRIATIGDGSCFVHSTLKSYLPTYQENNAYDFRTEYASKLRRDLAYNLQLDDPDKLRVSEKTIVQRATLGYLNGSGIPNDHPFLLNYETAANGVFISFYEQQEEGFKRNDPMDIPIDFSLRGLQDLFNSLRWLGDEIFGYIAQQLQITVYITEGFFDRKTGYFYLRYITDTAHLCEGCNAVVIMGNNIHFEVIGLETDEGYQTMFSPDDPFIQKLRRLQRKP